MTEDYARRPAGAEVLDERGRHEAPMQPGANGTEDIPLLGKGLTEDFLARWEQCQRDFVDEPRRSVEEADRLVDELIRQLVDQFAGERSRIEGQWGRGEEVSTDDLRFVLQRYRSFFNRLLHV